MNGLLDFLQAMNNSVASTISAPVDAIGWGLRKAGVPVPEDAVGSSAWMERTGLTRPVQPGAINVAGETMGLLSPALLAAKAPQVAAGLLDAIQQSRSSFGGLLSGIERMANSAEKSASYASRSVKIRDPQQLPQRPFDHDYQSAPAGAANERLAFDLEGRPLNPGATVFGRRVGGGVDEGARWGDAESIATRLGIPVEKVAAREIGGDAGRFSTIPGTILDPRIKIAESIGGKPLSAETADRVLQHELGHAIDKLASGGANIKDAGVVRELEHVYDFMNNRAGQQVAPRLAKKQHTPKADGYGGKDVRNEQWAEAIRLYMTDPNAAKTIAPKLMARIREVVNAHPTLSKAVQFNSAAGSAGLLGAGMLSEDDEGGF